MIKLRERLSFANVVSVIALFVALGGTGMAASQLGKNSVGAKQLKKNAVTTAKIKKEAVTAGKVKRGTLTGAQINASTLGTVPSAQTSHVAESVVPSEPWHEIGKPGEPQFENECTGGPGSMPGTGNAPAAFYKDREGVVHLKGEFTCGALGAQAFQLPPGYRPANFEVFPVAHGGELHNLAVFGASGPGVTPGNAGSVRCGLENQQCFLNGITFRAEG